MNKITSKLNLLLLLAVMWFGKNLNAQTNSPIGPNEMSFEKDMDIDIAGNHPRRLLLPIKVVEFSAESFKNKVTFEWTTTIEDDCDYFIIEMSPDGINWEKVGVVKGLGANGQTNFYSFNYYPEQDYSDVYYRLDHGVYGPSYYQVVTGGSK